MLRRSRPTPGTATTTATDTATDADLIARARALAPDDLLATCFRGNDYNKLGLLAHHRSYDLAMPDSPAAPLAPDAEAIPHNLIRAVFADLHDTKLAPRLAALKAATPARLICLAPPPPKEDGDFIIAHADDTFRQLVAGGYAVAPAALRRKLYLVEQEVLCATCRTLGIALLPPPPDALDAGGFLARGCYHTDATHANAAYGALVLRDLAMFAQADLKRAG